MEKYDIVMVIDTTASMGFFLESVKKSLPQFMLISKLLGNIDDFSIISYKDYCCPDVLQYSGWKKDINELLPFINNLNADGGSDPCECAKTACHNLHKIVKQKTFVFWFTDACPHSEFTKSNPSNVSMEKSAIGEDWDWLIVTKKLQQYCIVFPIIYSTSRLVAAYYIYLAEITGGICLGTISNTSDKISKNTIALFLNICGESGDYGEDIVQLLPPKRCHILEFEEEQEFLDNIGNIQIIKDIKPPVLNFNIDNISNKFFHDADYKKLVYDVFFTLLYPENVLALSYNPIFGKLWRAIARSRNDPERDQLIEKLGNTITKLPVNSRSVMDKFIEMSYNQQDQIDNIVEEAKDKYPALIYNGQKQFSQKEILEISRSCNNTILKNMTTIISGLDIIESGNLPRNYIPLSLSEETIFNLLPSLTSEGIMFSKRPSVILALLALQCNSKILKQSAINFLDKIKGTWFNKEIAENYTYNFIKLVNKSSDKLTLEEADHFDLMDTIGGIQINKLTDISVDIGYSSHKTMRPDFKIECISCHKLRSFTLLDKNKICGLCHVHLSDINDKFPDKSYWCECRRCKVHYAVVQIDKLNVEPKCHFCRKNEETPIISCKKCKNKFVCSLDHDILKTSLPENPTNFYCPPCTNNKDTLLKEEIKINILEWINANNLDIFNLKINNIDRFMSCNSIYRGKDFIEKINDIYHKNEYMIHGKTILNMGHVILSILEWIKSGNAELGECNCCFNDFNKAQIHMTCKNKKCHIKACTECLQSWYGNAVPGQIVHISNLTCPFCKSHPGINILEKYNREICGLKKIEYNQLDSSWYYAWCIDCYSLKQCIEKTCAGEDAPEIKNWRCELCDIAHKTKILGNTFHIVTKNCPSCGVMTLKTSGCNHIHCTHQMSEIRCDTHWCWTCNGKFDYSTIYSHMSKEHGSYFWGGDDREYYSDDSYYSDDY